MTAEQRKNSEPDRPSGGNLDELHAFLDLAEQELSRVLEQNSDLRAALSDRDTLIAQLRAELGKAEGRE